MFPRKTLSLITNFVLVFNCVQGFNISPQPNYVFEVPKTRTHMPKVRSSYFGYSITLRKNSVMVGAPRAQSSLDAQRKINETGAIYKCSFHSSGCKPFVFDKDRNTNFENPVSTNITNVYKDHQWLGASMDGNELDSEQFVVCAPRITTNWTWMRDEDLMHGICYTTPNTLKSEPNSVQQFAPLRDPANQYRTIGIADVYLYMYGEQGLSVHMTENGEEILIGAPGVFEWKGTVIRYKRQNPSEDSSNLKSDIPNPYYWGQSNDSYFGYALTSGYFHGSHNQKILYVASAPQENLHHGVVYIFDIVRHLQGEQTIEIYHMFNSTQMGQYFGYALAADDYNGDGFYDVAIGAPLFSKKGIYENGAVYVYRNLGEFAPGLWSSNFVLQTILLSNYNSGGRFGSSISKLGDINLDGYRDIAIGAPYEGNGVVYIYHGGSDGINAKASQKLTAPFKKMAEPFTPHMFGHSLSKGTDIDRNSYIDLAVGAPNAETVYVYKTYPIVKITGYVRPFREELSTNDTNLNFEVCWSLVSGSNILMETRLNIQINLDKKYQRVNFTRRQPNPLEFNTTANYVNQCQNYDAVVKYLSALIYKPIEIEMRYNVLNKVPDSMEFCSTCVAVNPFDSKVTISTIKFFTGCGNKKCVAELILTSTVLGKLPYVIGLNNSLSLEYRIQNFGETAYVPQVNISISNTVSFLKIPSSCELDTAQLYCDINNGSPLHNNESVFLKITLDTKKLEGTEIIVNASAFSAGDEGNALDNHVEDVIPLAKLSYVGITGKSNKQKLNLQDNLQLENFVYSYEIRNNGPTYLKNVDVILSIPVLYERKLKKLHVDVIPTENITVKSQYNNHEIEIEWLKTKENLLQNLTEMPSESIPQVDQNMNGMDLKSSEIEAETESSEGAEKDDERMIIEFENNFNNRCMPTTSKNVCNLEDSNLKNVSPNRTISFDCYNSKANSCVKVKFSVSNFEAGNTPIFIQLNFSIDLNQIDKILTDDHDIFVIRPSIDVFRNDDEKGTKMYVEQTYAFTILYKDGTIALWVYIVSVLAGLFILILLTYILYKLKFFRRAKKEELKVLVRQSLAQAPVDDGRR